MKPVPEPLKISTIYGIVEETVGPTTQFASKKAERLYRWWVGAMRDGQVPRRSDFDITEHADLVADIFLVQVTGDGTFLLKIHGNNVIDLLGVNRTGQDVTRHEGVRGYGHALAEYYQTIVTERVCKKCMGDLDHADRRHIRFESIDCPLAGDGADAGVVAIIGVMEQIR